MKKEKPYYLRQPWDILFKENKLDKVSPWSIDLVLLLKTLRKEMEKAGIDFRIAGMAIHSSVLIYLKKADMLLKMQELPTPNGEDKKEVYLPPALSLPFRFEHTTTTVQDLIEALEKTLNGGIRLKPPKSPIPPDILPDFLEAEKYLLEIENRSGDLLEELKWRFGKSIVISLTEFVYNLDRLETVRIFLMLLFLAQRHEINLFQDEEESEIFITLKERENEQQNIKI
jgi:chromatin segregation and condensation protein Rec8/ScpA/Scc1 (kleisin family)